MMRRHLILLLALAAQSALAWEAKPLREIAVHPERSAPAQVVSLNESKLAAELSTRIIRLTVEPGQRIARGALVAELDCRDFQLAAERAEAGRKASEAHARLAELQHARTLKLAADGFVSKDALDSQRAELDATRADVAVNVAALKTAQAVLDKCRVRAPFPAIVLERLAQEGEMAMPGTPLVSLLDTSRIELRAEVQQSDASGLKSARKIDFVTHEGRYPLRLVRLSPALLKASRLVEARLRFKAAAAPAGSSARMLWTSPEMHVPARFLVQRQGKLGVFVVGNGDPRFHFLPEAQEGRPALAAGLTAESRIVIPGTGEL